MKKEMIMKTEEKVIFTENNYLYRFSSLEDYVMLHPEDEPPMSYWNNKYRIGLLVDDLSYNKYYREHLRDMQTDDFISLLKSDAPSLEQFVEIEMLETKLAEKKEEMGNFCIERVPCDGFVCVDGQTYEGVDGLKKAALDNKAKVTLLSFGFPCFDSSDYLYENRSYNNFWFCDKASKMWEAVMAFNGRGFCHCLLTEELPCNLLPMVYYEDEKKTMVLAYDY